MGLITKLFGTRSEREIKRLSAQLSRIEALEQPYRQLSDEQLKAKTPELKARLAACRSVNDRHRYGLVYNSRSSRIFIFLEHIGTGASEGTGT